ncbi:MAG: NAD(P)H-hydrate epimerase [Candidatus Margulisiibacteriota bacterium]
MRAITTAEARQFDRDAQKKYGVPSIVLMENAGRAVAEEAIKVIRNAKRISRNARVVVVCGVGNNGGDGLVAARHLLSSGYKVEVLLVGDHSRLKNDPKINYDILKRLGRGIRLNNDLKNLKTGLIIDAIFGIGLRDEVGAPYRAVIEAINLSKLPVLSVDVPSGLDADTGEPLGLAVRAKLTVTFVANKVGFTKRAAKKYTGKVVVRDIGIRLSPFDI